MSSFGPRGGVILRDFSPEGSCAPRRDPGEDYICAPRKMLRELNITPLFWDPLE